MWKYHVFSWSNCVIWFKGIPLMSLFWNRHMLLILFCSPCYQCLLWCTLENFQSIIFWLPCVFHCHRCTVCLAEYREEDTLRILPLCGHYFHATCIDIWFQQQSTCPVCRISLRETAENKCCLQPLFSSAVRSQYTMGTLNVNSNQCSSSGQRHSSRLHDNQRTNPTASASNA